MNEHAIREILEGGGGAAGAACRALLYVPGKLYGGAMRLRRALYDKGVLAASAAPAPVISVGNLAAGGSGKTPLTALLASRFLEQGKKPAILLRGYRAAGAAGSDEAALYKTLCPGALVKVGPDRVASAREAAAAGAAVILMDDGFQHRKLRRDLDIVLIDALSPWGGGNTIPGGLLREPPAALAAARAILVTRSDQVSSSALAAIVNRIETFAPHALLLTARHAPVCLRTADGEELPLETLRGKQVVLLSGIARPEAFANTLRSLGADVADTFIGNDHRHFSPEFLEQALARAHQRNAPLVTTEKDGVKLPPLPSPIPAPLWILGVRQEVDNADALFRLVDEIVSSFVREAASGGGTGPN